jgi:hypothetical protein
MASSVGKIVPKDGSAILIVDNTMGRFACGKFGILVQNVGNVRLEFGSEQNDLQTSSVDQKIGFALDPDGMIVLSPFADKLYCHLDVAGANDGKVALYRFYRGQ